MSAIAGSDSLSFLRYPLRASLHHDTGPYPPLPPRRLDLACNVRGSLNSSVSHHTAGTHFFPIWLSRHGGPLMTSSFHPVLFSFSVYGFITFGVSRSVTIPLDICVHDRPVLPPSLRTFSCFRDLASHEHTMTRVAYDAVYDNIRPFLTLDRGFYSDCYPSTLGFWFK